ncbi:MAG: NAD(P)H-hydrate dehydratase [Clostridia bacterium]|nr:NAD(P)H-hydrate dehydratase [Clostridia bacterium]
MKVLLSNQIKTAEDNAVLRGIFSYAQLMKIAGDTATREILNRYNIIGKKICVLCGSGNNGGDGLVIAANLKSRGADVCLLTPIGFPSTDTALNFKDGVKDIKILDDFVGDFDIVIDALFGIGLNRFLSEKIATIIEKINSYNCTKIAIDIPSGVFCDGGEVVTAFRADLTLTFTAYKPCQLLPQTSEYCGETVVLDIGLPVDNYAYLTIDKPEIVSRPKSSHKGTFGTALLFCGSYGMAGAEILAARAALRSGVGIAKALVCDKNYSAFTASVPEAVTIPVDTAENGSPIVYDRTILSALSSSNALLIGCGLGRSDEARKLVIRTLEKTQIPTVIDADGINALQGGINIIRKINAPVILTPHPAEMARLCDTTTDEIQANRVKFAKKFAVENNCILALKGTNTIVATPNGRIFFNTTGNDGLATGGSGDVLSGMIVSRLAQGYDPLTAVLNSVWLHGAVADKLAESMPTRTILPSDIIEGLKTISD